MVQFEGWLQQFEVLWDMLDEVDAKCWVLEPESPTRACTYRRVVVGKYLLGRVVGKYLLGRVARSLW